MEQIVTAQSMLVSYIAFLFCCASVLYLIRSILKDLRRNKMTELQKELVRLLQNKACYSKKIKEKLIDNQLGDIIDTTIEWTVETLIETAEKIDNEVDVQRVRSSSNYGDVLSRIIARVEQNIQKAEEGYGEDNK